MGYQHVQDSSDLSDSSAIIEKKRHKCPFKGCNAAFSKPSKLLFHERRHTGERPHVCDEPNCSKTYTNSSHLRRHKKVYHEKRTQFVTCGHDGCGVVLSSKYNLKKHISNKHGKMFVFSCSVCSQGFKRKRQLQQHLYLHTGEAPFKCDKCNFSFITMKDFSKHKRSHKTYTCDCGNVFELWSLFLAHRKICRKNYKCEKCNREFSQLGNYKSHRLTHTEKEKKMVYTCPYETCKRFYFYKKNLIVHINKIHKKIEKNLKLKCTYENCSVILKTNQSLRQHLQRHAIKKSPKSRKTRKDKGKPKKCMASILSNVEVPLEKHREIIEENKSENKNDKEKSEINVENQERNMDNSEIEEEEISGTEDSLLEQCDLVLKKITEMTN